MSEDKKIKTLYKLDKKDIRAVIEKYKSSENRSITKVEENTQNNDQTKSIQKVEESKDNIDGSSPESNPNPNPNYIPKKNYLKNTIIIAVLVLVFCAGMVLTIILNNNVKNPEPNEADDSSIISSTESIDNTANESTDSSEIHKNYDFDFVLGDLTIYSDDYWRSNDYKLFIGENDGSLAKDVKYVTVKDGVTQIYDRGFYYCKNLESITLPESITYIGRGAFAGCESLKDIAIPSQVTNISNAAFRGCTDLKSVIIPSNVTIIGDYAFSECESLTLALPDKLESIGIYAFNSCTSIDNIIIPESVTNVGTSAFYNWTTNQRIWISDDDTWQDTWYVGCQAVIIHGVVGSS